MNYYKNVWMLPFESSRGCWWGAKHHCTFCGLNGQGMAYRAKTSERVMRELSQLSHKHHISAFEAVDNILDLKYLDGLFGQIKQGRLDYQFFYEVKANLSRAQIKTLYEGGVRRIQPGIESMSTNILRLMRKGCSMLQNVICLKWALYYDIRVSWNLIWGFPGETRADYEKELEVLKRITHLEPPKGSGRIWLERFSPNYTDRETFPVRNVRPEASYSHVYPAHVNLDKAAYFFDYVMGDTVPAETHLPTGDFLNEWQESWDSDERHALTYRRTSDGLLIDYKWGADKQGTYSLFGPLALIYEFCVETTHTVDQVVRHLQNSIGDSKFSAAEVQDVTDEFCSANLMLSEDGKYLSLALPANRTW
jgi:ribosomal peptide maturation radical SAM protein 1